MTDIITNGTEIKNRIISEINSARECVYIAMAWFTDRDIANTIIQAKNRRVIVDIVLSSNVQNETVKLMLRGADVSVHAFETGDERGMMHHKFCLIDRRISINGSYNYSYNASNNNVENIHVSDDPDIYRQLLSEFERIRLNIDNNIALNVITKEVTTEAQTQKNDIQLNNPIDTFYQQLHDLVYSSAKLNSLEYKNRGYEKAKESAGNIDIFESEYRNIKEEIRVYATDEGLSSNKSILISNITSAYETKKARLEAERQRETVAATKSIELSKRQISDRISNMRLERALLETGNQSTGEKGLLQFNKEIEKIKLEMKALEQSFVTKKFWSVGTLLVTLLLVVFAFYLSVFFASALYKVFFEGNVIRNSLEAGINPGLPQLVDANAIIKIFNQQGILFGFIATIFFLFPVLLSNIKLLGSENKGVNNLLFWVGLLIFDILVAAMVAMNTDEIRALLVGKEPQLQLWEVIKQGEFWLIFVFGMMPLIITHFSIDYIYSAYKKSQRELVDAGKAQRIKILDEEMIDLNSGKSSIELRIGEKNNLIKENDERLLNLEREMNNSEQQIEKRYTELLAQIRMVFDDFSAKVTSGKIFTDEILHSVVSAFKSGFVEYLPTYYSEDEVANRVGKIDKVITVNK